MKTMTKGAIATGLGVALLLGGGGTLAVWNQAVTSEAGTIAAGNLDLAADTGVWTDAAGQPVDLSTFKIVPGEKLTYTQALHVTLEGDNIAATLSLSGAAANNGFTAENVEVTPTVVTKDGAALSAANVLTPADTGAALVASTSFEFLSSTTGQDSANSTYDFSTIGYTLEQIAPASAAG